MDAQLGRYIRVRLLMLFYYYCCNDCPMLGTYQISAHQLRILIDTLKTDHGCEWHGIGHIQYSCKWISNGVKTMWYDNRRLVSTTANQWILQRQSGNNCKQSYWKLSISIVHILFPLRFALDENDFCLVSIEYLQT